MDYLHTLNPMQREAVLHRDGPLLIFAGAGSGKTRVLTYRIAHLIENGVSPFHIIAITFTNKAAREMRERVEDTAPMGSRCWVATFHATCVRILRRDIESLGFTSSFSIFDTSDSERLIKTCLEELNLSEKDYAPKQVLQAISAQKNELATPAAFAKQAAGNYRQTNIADVYDLYQRKLRANSALDFDDIIFRTVELFEKFPDVLARYQDRFRYVMVDEYQDTNTAQYRLIALLAGARQNLCVVGDDDQSIYGWRGANIQNILNFKRDFPAAQVIKLEQNYRSSQTILDAANAVIRNNDQRSEKALWTENGPGTKIKVHRAVTDQKEAHFVVGRIRDGVEKDGAAYNDFAVLYRNNAQSRTVEDQLVLAGIPYRLYGGVRFYERMEVKDILAYLKAIDNPQDDIAWGRIINVPRRGIGDKSIRCLLDHSVQAGLPLSGAIQDAQHIPGLTKKARTSLLDFAALMQTFREMAAQPSARVTELLQKILADTDYRQSLEDGTDIGLGRIQNVDELLAKAIEFEGLSARLAVETQTTPAATPTETLDELPRSALSAFLEDVALVADIDNMDAAADTVSLMTMHSAKGLEFPTVFLVGFEEGLFPSYRAATATSFTEMEEERRLCYVGITRAKAQLYLLSAVSRVQYGQTVCNAPSRFLKEIPPTLCEDVRTQDFLEKPARRGLDISLPKRPTPERSALRPNPYRTQIPTPQNKPLDFGVGDTVRQLKYGPGTVTAITPAGADYEVTIQFDRAGEKKLMAHLSRLAKV